MNKYLSFILITILAIFVVNISYSQVEFYDGSYDEALEKAKKEKKSIMVDFYAEWCGWCKVLDKKVYSQKEIGDYLNVKCINMKMDGDTTEGGKLSSDFSISGYPTIIFISAEG